MKSTLRKIGNSRGVLIPASFLAACAIDNDIELRLEDGRIIIEPVKAPRAGWFDAHTPDTDDDAWSELTETEQEQEDWEW
jgi:antitoxin MazE